MIRAVAWDIDGTLIDSEPTHNAALAAVSARYGAPIAPDDPRFLGVAMEAVFAQLSPLYPRDLTFARWLDEAVADCYGWPKAIAQDDAEIVGRLTELNRQITTGEREYHPFA